MTIRIRVARSATESLWGVVTEATRFATLTGYGFLVAIVWIYLAARLH